MNEEIWKDIIGFEGHYQISNLGRVKSLARLRLSKGGCLAPLKEKILKQKIGKTGYPAVHLRKDEVSVHPTIHRLVAEMFIENVENKATVNHIDGCKTNNHVSNLEWSTHSEQMVHAFKNDLAKKRGRTKYSPEFQKEVRDYILNHGISLVVAAKLFDISERTAGRFLKQEVKGASKKLSDSDVESIKIMRKEGNTLKSISEIFGCGISQIHRITRGESRAIVYER